ncbi:MAG: Pycsar system effector family protein [Nonlabens ulvanivorans]|uniref:HD domain-containing protein n=7 Tax=Nonlabens ulvanivorans TaxID=906888 RepID=A0A081DF43_NONUL|nr:Pycsar system effector family protein [Nonlabens ulvanivorans]KEZ93333.1 phosphohydrolase [Nonlabens ulvanivorans]PRX13542.1 HD domain-containing protein [Nonlabens ulvanivorans]GAK77539.1 metal-dependent phosphohydrolase [Nonlabens ulvanivorans]
MTDNIFLKVDDFVLELFKTQLDETYVYHNYMHTARVVKSTKEIIENTEIDVKEEQALIIAAWLHDTGYIHGADGHEERSATIAEDFLKDNGADQSLIELVKQLILATKFNGTPKTTLEEILRDADASHFAKDYYDETSELLKKELELRGIATYTNKEWRKENIRVFTEKHRYYSDYAIKNWNKDKNENLMKLLKKKKKNKQKLKKEKLKVDLKNQSPERAIQTLFRTALRNHIKLSDIADTKANILLSVNAIIISLALANLIPKLEQVSNRHLLWPTLILVLFSVASIVLSIMSTRPNITSGEFTDDEVRERKVNLLFFGNFHKMPLNKYKDSVMDLLEEKEEVYESLIKDLYYLGVVLARKYKLLRLTYTIFMIGIIGSVLAFVIAFALLDLDSIVDVIPATNP